MTIRQYDSNYQGGTILIADIPPRVYSLEVGVISLYMIGVDSEAHDVRRNHNRLLCEIQHNKIATFFLLWRGYFRRGFGLLSRLIAFRSTCIDPVDDPV